MCLSTLPPLKSAVTLNPHIAEYWLGLASAFASTGAGDQPERALERALEVDPNTPRVSRAVANAFEDRRTNRIRY
jgi:cytochrome c-type biogenesis protein CcmH/NrfG